MIEARQFLINHGAPILFGAILVEQIGLPLPALPWLLAAGALAAAGKFNPVEGVVLTMAARLIADTAWFFLGRYGGHRVLNWLCRISLEPDSCVRRTQNLFTRYGWRAILVSKFVPGLGTVTPPLAGMSGLSARRFLSLDALGAMLYGSCYICLGYLFSSQIQHVGAEIASVGGRAVILIAGAAAIYLAFKFWQRKRLLRDLRMTRITVDDLRQMQDAGEPLVIIDLRSIEELEHDQALIKGAIHLTMDDIKHGRHEIPRDVEVIVYCSCPNEITSARVALMLRRHGFSSVRPLLGGMDAWRKQNYPLSRRSDLKTTQETDGAIYAKTDLDDGR